MKVSRMIKLLENCDQDAEVKYGGLEGNNVLFVTQFEGHKDIIVIEDQEGNDIGAELGARLDNAIMNDISDEQFCEDLFETGFLVSQIEEYIPEKLTAYKKYIASKSKFIKGE